MEPVDTLSVLAQDPEPRFVEIAKHQDEFLTLPALVYNDGRVLTEWSFTEDERARIANGENLRLWIWATWACPHCHAQLGFQPLTPEITSEHHA